MINGISLEVEILTGESVGSASSSLCRLSDKLGIMITSNFNGAMVCVTPSSSPEDIVDEIHREMDRGK